MNRKDSTPRPSYFEIMARLAETQGGFFYPWKSVVGPDNGEDAYTHQVEQHLSPEIDVLEPGCGHGVDAIRFAPRVRSIVAYDAVQAFVDIAEREAAAKGIGNVTFVTADSSPKRGGRIPADSGSFDLFISRRGPTNWILDARRVARPGATLMQLNPMPVPVPDWNDELPEKIRFQAHPDSLPARIGQLLADAGIAIVDGTLFDVPEEFTDPRELYVMLTWQRVLESVPTYEESRATFSRIFERHADGDGRLVIRHRRYLWTARI